MARTSVLIIGEDPSLVDFDAPGAPPDMSAAKVMDGLNGSVERLRVLGVEAELLLTNESGPVEDQVLRSLSGRHFDVIVIGAGLRTLPPMAAKFEAIMNVLHHQARNAKFAFNTKPDDSDVAALRQLSELGV